MEHYFQSGLATSTRRTYQSAQTRFRDFCRASHSLPVPTSEQQLCRYVAHLAGDNLSYTTVKTYLAAVRQLQVAEGWGDPEMNKMPRLAQVIRGIKAAQARSPSASRAKRLPITLALLRKIKKSWQGEENRWNSTMLWAAVTMCFFGFLRSGEITLITAESFDEGAHLTFSDVTVDSLQDPRALTIRLKTSKTDPFRVGVDVCIGRTDCDLCPVAAVLAYMVLRGRGKGPFFRFKDGSPLTRARYVSEVKRALTKAGVDSSHYSGHSFRSGAATTAAQQGIGDATIKLLGRWKSGAYQLYVKIPQEKLADYSKNLAGGGSYQ